MTDEGECGVSRCGEAAFGSVPADSPPPGDRSFVDGHLRLPTCVEHGRKHHRLVLGREPRPGDVTIRKPDESPDE